MSNVVIKPRLIDGSPAIVRDPATLQPLKAGGEAKPLDSYWARRLRDGDVVEVSDADAAAADLSAAPAEPFRQPNGV
jgi:hypothetical protein